MSSNGATTGAGGRARQQVHLELSAEAERYVRDDAPLDVRLMAAGGGLPLPPLELATILFVLAHDSESEVKDRARQSLEALPENICSVALSGPAHPSMLSYCAHLFRESAPLLECIALNHAAGDGTIAFLATLPFKRIVEIISNNQERMLRCPDIVESLGNNPLTGRAVIDRILNFLGLERPEGEVLDEQELPPLEPVDDETASAVLRAVLGSDVSGFARELIEDDAELDEAQASSVWAMVQNMSVFDKIKLARLGNKEARALLVRDPNKLVASAAVRSPKVTDLEVIGFAKSRNVGDEVLRIISSSREWTRSYQVKLALSANPKTPQPAAVKFLNYLQDKDLKNMMKSKEVSSVVATQARRILQKKGKL